MKGGTRRDFFGPCSEIAAISLLGEHSVCQHFLVEYRNGR